MTTLLTARSVASKVGIGTTATLGTLGLLAAPASAQDSGPISTHSGDCQGRWFDTVANSGDGGHASQIETDDDTTDGHFCYVNWGFSADVPSRFESPTDHLDPVYHNVQVGSHQTIFVQVCWERSGGPDTCSGPFSFGAMGTPDGK